MAIVTIVISIGLMVKSADNNITWVQGRGPGAGAWPFWLSAILLLSSIATLVRWFMRATPESRNTEPYIDREALYIVGVTAVALVVLLLATHLIGLYLALMAFLFFYVKIVGGHRWPTTIGVVIGMPVFIFGLFEWALTIPLPKGISQPLFIPIYRLIY
jgi:hypothetical protein